MKLKYHIKSFRSILGLFKEDWFCPWRSSSIAPQNNRDLNQGLLHLWSKFGYPSLNGSQVIARTSKWLTHRLTHSYMDTHTHTQTQVMTIPEGQNWPRVKKKNLYSMTRMQHMANTIWNTCFLTQSKFCRISIFPIVFPSFNVMAQLIPNNDYQN